jgi:hypothetical protein
MSDKKPSLGQAIDQIIESLEPLELTARQTAIEAACSHLGLVVPFDKGTERANNGQRENDAGSFNGRQVVDIRSLKDQKIPKNASQMACLVAYYLQELAPQHEQKQSINSADLLKYFKQAGFKLPKVMTQILPDAKSSGYFDPGSAKGEYILNAVGYNLVAHNLPQSSGK